MLRLANWRTGGVEEGAVVVSRVEVVEVLHCPDISLSSFQLLDNSTELVVYGPPSASGLGSTGRVAAPLVVVLAVMAAALVGLLRWSRARRARLEGQGEGEVLEEGRIEGETEVL